MYKYIQDGQNKTGTENIYKTDAKLTFVNEHWR